MHLRFCGFAVALELLQSRLRGLVVVVELLDAEFGALGFVEVLVDDTGVGLAEADEVDDVGEDFDEARVGGLVEVVECEVCYAALDQRMSAFLVQVLWTLQLA